MLRGGGGGVRRRGRREIERPLRGGESWAPSGLMRTWMKTLGEEVRCDDGRLGGRGRFEV